MVNISIDNSTLTKEWLIYKLTQDVARCKGIENNDNVSEIDKIRYKAEWEYYEKILNTLLN